MNNKCTNQKGITYKYLRIQGREIIENTQFAKGIFSMLEQLAYDGTMDEEDKELFEELNNWFVDVLPFPEPCQRKEKVVCYFKTENNDEIFKYVNPLLWLLDRYKKPYYVVYTNYPGEIVYEDNYQIVVKVYDQVIEKFEKKVTGIKEEK